MLRYANQYQRVPASYGQRYRDTQRYLYRYNDGRIYQIDRRNMHEQAALEIEALTRGLEP